MDSFSVLGGVIAVFLVFDFVVNRNFYPRCSFIPHAVLIQKEIVVRASKFPKL